MLAHPLQKILDEDDYKYGPLFETSMTRSSNGCPPSLGEERAVCNKFGCRPAECAKYVELAEYAVEAIKTVMGAHIPENSILLRTFPEKAFDAYTNLCLYTYFMQEYMPDGVHHPLYKAVTQTSFSEFEKGIKQYKKSRFTERDYKYGATYNAGSGCPPALGYGRAVCSEWNVRYVEKATVAIEMIADAIGDNMPQIDITFRTTQCEIGNVRNHLCLMTYLMQEYHPDGADHPLYKAVTQERFSDFEKGIEECKQQW